MLQAMRRVISKTIESGLITAVSPRSGPGFSSFVSVMSTVALDGVVSSSLAVFDSSVAFFVASDVAHICGRATLESVDEYGTISLPASRSASLPPIPSVAIADSFRSFLEYASFALTSSDLRNRFDHRSTDTRCCSAREGRR